VGYFPHAYWSLSYWTGLFWPPPPDELEQPGVAQSQIGGAARKRKKERLPREFEKPQVLPPEVLERFTIPRPRPLVPIDEVLVRPDEVLSSVVIPEPGDALAEDIALLMTLELV
jgi:hypothetical protein